MIDPTRLAAIKALQSPGEIMLYPKPVNYLGNGTIPLETHEITDGGKYWCAHTLRRGDAEFFVAAADPEYGLQALAAEVERLQEREKGVRLSCDSPDNRACACGGWPLLNWSYCPDCGRRLDWK